MIVFGSLIFYYFLNSNENNSVMLLFLIISREIIGLPGFLIILIRGKDPYKVRYIGKAVCWFQGFALGAVIINVSWAIYLVVPTCLIGIVSGIDYLRYSIE
jgi:phosphatidylglycerophosphate synthase